MGSKIDVKLGVGEHQIQNFYMYVSFHIFGSKSRRISVTKEICQRFFENSKKLLVFEFWWVVLIFDYAPTSSLRGPATQHLNPRPKAEFDEWMHGRNIKSVL